MVLVLHNTTHKQMYNINEKLQIKHTIEKSSEKMMKKKNRNRVPAWCLLNIK